MANLLQQDQNATETPCRHHKIRCMWGLLHLLDFHQRIHMRKLLAHTKRTGNGKHGVWLKLPNSKPKVPSNDEEDKCLGGEACLSPEKPNQGKRSPSRRLYKSLILKKKPKEQAHKQKISPLASQLLRTVSMHHLKSDEHLLACSTMSDMEESSTATNAQGTDFPAGSGRVPLLNHSTTKRAIGKQSEIYEAMNTLDHADQIDELGNHVLKNQSLLHEKLAETKYMQSKQKSKVKEVDLELQQLQFFSKMTELFNTNKELFLKFLQDPAYGVANYLLPPKSSASDVLLSTCGSFSGAEPQDIKDDGPSATKKNNIKESKDEHLKENKVNFVSQDRNSYPASHPFTDVEQAMKLNDVAKASNEETTPPTSGSSVDHSADLLAGTRVDVRLRQQCQPSVSHVRPIKKHFKEIIKDNKHEHRRISMDGFLHKIPCGQTLSDNTRKEVPNAPGLQCYPWDSPGNMSKRSRKKIKGLTRSHTLNEALDRYYHLLDITLRKESTTLPGGPKSVKKDDNHQGGMPPKCLGRIFSLPDIGSHFFIQDDDSDYPEASMSEAMPITGAEDSLVLVQTQYFDKPLPTSNHLHIESLASVSNIEKANGIINLREQHKAELTTEQELCDPYGFDTKMADQIHQMPLNDTEAGDERHSSSKPTGLNLNLDLDLEERPCGPRTCSTKEDSELEHINVEEIDALTSSKGKIENTEVYVSKVHIPWKTKGIGDLHFEVDQKDEAIFNLVREMLSKCIYDSNELRGAYQNAYEQLDTLLTSYADAFVDEHDSGNAALEISADFQLLFDLITELLIRIYDNSNSNFSWLPRFNYNIKPKPDEYHILEEVWTSIKYLSSQTPDDSMFEYLVTQDFLKNDGWITLHVDMEYVGEELEELILDDLLEEVINFVL